MTITLSTRFAVLQRDKHTCQYCGRSSPHVVLELDHVEPRAAGGSDRRSNLITACFECNRGKGARPLEYKLRREVRLWPLLAGPADGMVPPSVFVQPVVWVFATENVNIAPRLFDDGFVWREGQDPFSEPPRLALGHPRWHRTFYDADYWQHTPELVGFYTLRPSQQDALAFIPPGPMLENLA